MLEAAASKPVAIALDELVTSAAVRWRHRDEKNREDRYRGYAAALAAAEAAALESGKQLNPDDVPEVRRHPVYLRIEHLAASDIARAVAKARDVDGSVETKGSTWLQRASARLVSPSIPRRASRVGLQLSPRPRTSRIGRDAAEI